MNLTLNNLNIAAGAPSPASTAPVASAGAASDSAGAALLALDMIDGAAAAAQAPVQPALAFAQWLGLDQGAPAAEAAAPAPEAALPVAELPADEQQPATDNVLLGAMSMALPLMPVAQTMLAAVAAALPGVPAAKEPAAAADTDVPLPAGGEARAGAAVPAQANASAPVPASLQAVLQAVPAQSAPTQPAPASTASNTPASGTAGGAAFTLGDALAASEGKQEQGAPAAERAPAAFGVTAPATGAPQRGTDTVALSGPPTAWRQTLQEALGDRLQLQASKGAEQAVIRLEPPMLGRVEIAIRHSAGSLEVNISATHGEVLRQLQNVSENLRNDLAQRQFTDVAVNVAPAPRSANATPQFAGDGNQRGRQQDGREQDQTPGNALGEANTGAYPFSLNGRA